MAWLIELMDLTRVVIREADAMGTVGVVGALLIVSKYLVDLLRSRGVQWLLRLIGQKAGVGEKLMWVSWSASAKKWIAMGQAFLVALFGSVLAGMDWSAALIAAAVAAVGSKGLHDASFMPGRKPSPLQKLVMPTK